MNGQAFFTTHYFIHIVYNLHWVNLIQTVNVNVKKPLWFSALCWVTMAVHVGLNLPSTSIPFLSKRSPFLCGVKSVVTMYFFPCVHAYSLSLGDSEGSGIGAVADFP